VTLPTYLYLVSGSFSTAPIGGGCCNFCSPPLSIHDNPFSVHEYTALGRFRYYAMERLKQANVPILLFDTTAQN
jgi:hypothetical protein